MNPNRFQLATERTLEERLLISSEFAQKKLDVAGPQLDAEIAARRRMLDTLASVAVNYSDREGVAADFQARSRPIPVGKVDIEVYGEVSTRRGYAVVSRNFDPFNLQTPEPRQVPEDLSRVYVNFFALTQRSDAANGINNVGGYMGPKSLGAVLIDGEPRDLTGHLIEQEVFEVGKTQRTRLEDGSRHKTEGSSYLPPAQGSNPVQNLRQVEGALDDISVEYEDIRDTLYMLTIGLQASGHDGADMTLAGISTAYELAATG